MKNSIIGVFFLVVVLMFLSCRNENFTPKPRGYFRIDLPEKSWLRYDSLINYAFDYPVYAEVLRDPLANNEEEWVNINFPKMKASLHLSYKKLNNDLNMFAEDARSMALKHLPKANTISDSLFYIQKSNVFGTVYQIGGKGVASPIQFYATDSVSHFVRGALYFNFKPNNDSVDPVIRFIKQDILHFLHSLEWASN